ncbi:MAG: S8 family serine peptidase [Acidobacteria bacterium]|nr:S8 family serine peptidase [Acidobacteriota bacterium]
MPIERGSRLARVAVPTTLAIALAAPHVAGVVALLLQANPGLTPARVEGLIESAAYQFAFGAPYDPTTTSSFDKGHGLVDAQAAVLAALN